MQTKKHSRRDALRFGGTIAASGVAAATLAGPAQATPRTRIAALADITPGAAIDFDYPDGAAALLIDLGQPVEGGAGPDSSIAAFSALCQHMGCTVKYRDAGKDFFCPCHASRFDALRSGMAVDGPAPRGLPRILLEIVDGEIFATGIDGLVYGFACHA